MRIQSKVVIDLAMAKLDWFELHPERASEFGWKAIESACGRGRKALWKNKEIYARFSAVKSSLKGRDIGMLNDQRRKRLTDEQRIRKLTADNGMLQHQCDSLIEALLAVYQQFGDQLSQSGFDIGKIQAICNSAVQGVRIQDRHRICLNVK